jgi:hypothetical protein
MSFKTDEIEKARSVARDIAKELREGGTAPPSH